MKTLRILIGLALGTVTCAATEEKPAPTMPNEVILTTGRVLRNVQVIRWDSNRVVLKHSAGADPIAFSLIKSPDATTLEAIRKGWRAPDKPKADVAQAAPGVEMMTYNGQAFIVTRGAGNYKLGGIVVRVYFQSPDSLRQDLRWSSSLPTPAAIATTDADGKFTFKAPATGTVTLVAKARRLAGSSEEKYLWVHDVSLSSTRAAPILSNSNLEPEPYVQSGAYNEL